MENTNRTAIASGLTAAILLAARYQTVVPKPLPRILSESGGLTQLSRAFAACMLKSTITVPIYRELSDIYGRRDLSLGGIIVFLLGSVACVFSKG